MSENHPWIESESHGDQELLDLLVARESLFDKAIDEGKISIHDQDVAAEMERLRVEIAARKSQLGIDPISEP